ncbi:glyoxylase-like metal-dependent hydrolase (beta-lactamase superfamily II) [Hymenobacter luteus]|uniref:Glyoxylase-like metal-dependent hydrolase (Beta-lactamase superfamily II) n=2 Tax=Hymenobacter TaxID=89966 RepID=A0A7W9SZS3_9BACT|nr:MULTISPECIES: MBL fold metallo-hydrolase [Hymenobacter]MBB4600861.1 glyoxylase-like metal-dependent hydrolase (beta-lactamase superfamily II)/rhodanese-related sulfurtransferase [Hymenobacter latericoloratus]MBB6058932.1 glyoxylase-like metal-dependent hydrolase (beta-lactamase superfamily II) [Hymenobacter luteus]
MSPLPSSTGSVQIQQFYDKGLAHASYAIRSGRQVAIIDPARDPQPYYDFADEHDAKIIAVIETHPHADFVSSHLEIARETGATIYASKLVKASYPHQPFDDGQRITLGTVELHALNTPGHSPDSISILLMDELGQSRAVFTGDTLFVGDVGRPDLRESDIVGGHSREELAAQLYQSTRQKLMTLPAATRVYPAHGPGSLCGKTTSPDLDSTIGKELKTNYALQPMSQEEFIKVLLEDQPFMPKYFGHDVVLNKNGAPSFEDSVRAVPRLHSGIALEPGVVVIDTRPAEQFRAGHLPGAINLMDGGKFETWLGSIVGPQEPFYLIADSQIALDTVIRKTAKIGYEGNIKGALLAPRELPATSPDTDVEHVRQQPQDYTIVDIRNRTEAHQPIFDNALLIPLPELRERAQEVPTTKPVLVHCAGGYRSAAGASILQAALPASVPVYDLGEAISTFQPQSATV